MSGPTDWTRSPDVDRIPVHCGRQADHFGDGEWECQRCEARVHQRNVPGQQVFPIPGEQERMG